jgi:hypothetical protein
MLDIPAAGFIVPKEEIKKAPLLQIIVKLRSLTYHRLLKD